MSQRALQDTFMTLPNPRPPPTACYEGRNLETLTALRIENNEVSFYYVFYGMIKNGMIKKTKKHKTVLLLNKV